MKKTYTAPEATEVFEVDIPEEVIYRYFFRPRLSFGQKLMIYVTVWATIIFCACATMWNIMQQYEEAQPWYTVENYIASSGQSAFFTALTGAYGDSVNSYESLYGIASDLSAKYSGRLTYKKVVREYTYENPVYLLCSGDENLLKLTLQRGEKTGFLGLLGYEIRTAELVNSDILSFSDYPLVYPKGASVKINGKAFEPDSTDRYSVFGSDGYVVCMLENMLEVPEVKVSLDGRMLSPASDGFVYDYPARALSTATVDVPTGASVYVNGTRLPDGFTPTVHESAPDRFGNTVSYTSYVIPTVIGEITVTATLGENDLSFDCIDSVYTFAAETLECRVVAPSGAAVYANGEEISSEAATGSTVWRSDFEDVNNAPMATEYVFTDIYAIPEFSAVMDGEELTLAIDDESYVFLMPPSDELKAEYTDKTVRFMNAYLYYTTQGYSNTRANLNAVKAHVASPSPLYTNLERSYVGYYYIAPQQMTVDLMEVDNFVPYGENAFTCELSYKLTLKNWVGEAVDENTMRIAFAKRGNTFLPVNMTLANN